VPHTTPPYLHPVAAATHPSEQQIPAITHRGSDVVVTAGAGAGKTRTLVARYLSLLAEGIPPRAIIAITFTRKAAREMRNRVRQEMAAYIQSSDLSPDERRSWQDLYRQLDAARIDTIHGLCAAILRAHPVESGLDPGFAVLDEGSGAILQNQAVEAAMAYAADKLSMVPLYAHLKEKGLRDTLSRLLRTRLDSSSAFAALPRAPKHHWLNQIFAFQQQELEAMRNTSQWVEAVNTIECSRCNDANDLLEAQRRLALRAIEQADGPIQAQMQALRGLGDINTSGGKTRSWPGGKEQIDEVKRALKALKELWTNAASFSLEWNAVDDLLVDLTPLVRSLFELMVSEYGRAKEDRSALDFDDMEYLALQTLENSPCVRRMWREAIAAILVDEFQDTNQRQRDIIAHLSGDSHKLFIVGDAKQSIYAFRGADVTVFRAERARLEETGALHISLNTTYRAHSGLVQGLNELLRPALGTEANAAEPWIEPFSAIMPARQHSHPAIQPPYIELHLTVGTKTGGALNRAAQALATRLIQIIESQNESTQENHPLGYGDVAVLCRASTAFPAYEDAFEEAGIPFLTVAGRGFHARPEIRDVLNALRAVADPTDDLSLAGLLRSPAVGLSDTALVHLKYSDSGLPVALSLWDRLDPGTSGLDEEDQAAVRRGKDIVMELHQLAGRVSVAELLKEFLDHTGYRAALLTAGNWRAARNISKLLADAHSSGIVNVNEFLEFISALRDIGTREGEARATASGAVQIMTIHAAKGLEFPIVVVGDVTRQTRASNKGLVVDPQWGVVLDVEGSEKERPSVAIAANAIQKSRESAEDRRLLYVAATRAKEKLMLNGCVTQAKDGSLTASSSWLDFLGFDLAALPIDYAPQGESCLAGTLKMGSTSVAYAVYEPFFPPVAANLHDDPQGTSKQDDTVLPPPLVAPLDAAADPIGEDASAVAETAPTVWRVVPTARRPRAPRRLVGSLVHEALAQWRFPDEDFADWVTTRAREHGLTDKQQIADSLQTARRVLSRFQDHELYHRINNADEHLHEIPYSYRSQLNPPTDTGRIDCLFRVGDEWTIVDFKTDDVPKNEDPVHWAAQKGYLKQLRRYVTAVKTLRRATPEACICLLDFDGKVRLVYN
jgi:ATP-dependent helicase/nuclease subunit A